MKTTIKAAIISATLIALSGCIIAHDRDRDDRDHRGDHETHDDHGDHGDHDDHVR